MSRRKKLAPVVVDRSGWTTDERTRSVVAESLNADPAQIDLASQLVLDLRCDKLNLVEIQSALECEFGIGMLPDSEFDACQTVQDLVGLIGRHLPRAGSGVLVAAAA